MSSSAREDVVEDTKLDELDEAAAETETAAAPAEPVKRKRGRPPGSKNKKTLAAQAAGTAGSSTAAGASTGEPPAKRGRGRPPKRKPEETADAEPQPKRKRGRPPKAKPAPPPEEASGEDAAEEEGGEEPAPTKKKAKSKDAS